jgi:isopentenyl diphosphate isomerase/L-lactate dehydrogenase-like FMN-dependent dehydrogenase
MRRQRVDRILNVAEMREHAKKLPRAVFDAIDGGAGDEITLRANRSAYERIWIRPRALADVRTRDLSTTVLGTRISLPVMLAPCSFGRMANSEAELAVARAAAAVDTIYACPGGSSYPPERVMAAAPGPKWYQLYLPGDREAAEAILATAERAGYEVLCVTVDTAVFPGNRERDYRNKLEIPLKLSPKLLLAGASHPLWARDFLFGKVGRQNVGPGALRQGFRNFANTIMAGTPVTADDVRWLRERWKGPLVVKGIQRGDECPLLVDIGVDGIVVSNHGGRNQDGVLPTIEVLPEVVKAVDGRVEVYVDGGIQRGWDVFKALALGAQAVLVGKAHMYGLAVGGEAGVARVIEILRTELERTMALAGCATIADIDASLVRVDPSIPLDAHRRQHSEAGALQAL